MSTELVVPDPGAPILPGWLEGQFVPAVAATTDWDQLDEVDRRVNMFIGYLEQNEADLAVLRAALRAVEIQRGVLLNEHAPHGGDRSQQVQPGLHLPPENERPSHTTETKWRRMAEHRDTIWPRVIEAARKGKTKLTTQAYCLKLVRENTPANHGGRPGLIVPDPSLGDFVPDDALMERIDRGFEAKRRRELAQHEPEQVTETRCRKCKETWPCWDVRQAEREKDRVPWPDAPERERAARRRLPRDEQESSDPKNKR